ncbi:porin [Curvibacter sp. HBC61]|uniref:Porin n=1 Tax=Curvibacter cyanobacteriorum TaxID=3026422 RepID=A0ABT5N0H7_9BURK|nr:porin [Curvibacter sp. HBC61]MDD0839079.1 porin [Curvibacter sp. HBC61]
MKKSLIALAVLAASGAAMAQSSVTLFGVLDLGYENVKTEAGRISGISPSANSSSRLGFRGVEDLGGGMAASFWLEAAINPSSGIGSSGTQSNNQAGVGSVAAGGLTFNRRSTLSLSSSFGELRIGRDYVPSFWNTAVFDAFGANSVGAVLANYTGNASAATFVRASNSIGYFLPGKLGGFYGQGMYAFGNRASNEKVGTVDTSDNGRYVGLRAGYAQGPVDVAVAYGKTNYAARTVDFSQLAGSGTAAAGDFTDVNFGGSYDFGVAKAMGTITNQKINNLVTNGNNKSIKGWSLGANAPIGAGNVLVQYSQVKLDSAKADKWSFGYTYNLSKRTAAYGIVARVGNSGGAAMTAGSFSSGSLSAVTGSANVNKSSTGFSVGLRTSF